MKLQSEITAYFKNLSENHLTLKNSGDAPYFFRSQQEAIDNIKKVKDWIIYIDQRRGAILNNHHNINKDSIIPLVILKRHEKNDYQAQEDCLDDTFEVASDFLSHILKDRREVHPGTSKPIIEYIDVSNIPFSEERNVFDSFSGQRIQLTFVNHLNLFYNENKWHQPTTEI
jgi:hypothetical protein